MLLDKFLDILWDAIKTENAPQKILSRAIVNFYFDLITVQKNYERFKDDVTRENYDDWTRSLKRLCLDYVKIEQLLAIYDGNLMIKIDNYFAGELYAFGMGKKTENGNMIPIEQAIAWLESTGKGKYAFEINDPDKVMNDVLGEDFITSNYQNAIETLRAFIKDKIPMEEANEIIVSRKI